MTRDTKGTHGVYVLADNTTEANIGYWKNEMKNRYETPDQYGKSMTIEYEETTKETGNRYINFWVG